MKNIFYSFLSLKLKIGVFFFFILFSLVLNANNIEIKEPVRVVSVSGGYATIEVHLTWDNSWRDIENWDAAYVFLKYRKSGGNWTHVAVQVNGNVISSPYTYMTATPKWSTAPGVFVYRNSLGNGAADITCRLLWATGYSQEQFDNGEVEVFAQAVEMVFVSNGGFVLGDSVSSNCFADISGKPTTIGTEASNIGLGYKQEGGVYEKVTVASSYPKGYQGFYMMKHEVTQEQYVAFLNTLTLAQQQALHPNWSRWKEGNYIFGNPEEASCRNGIIMAYHVNATVPMIFANDYNRNDEYNSLSDGQTLACNYMSILDLLAYTSWAGLRPMSEMEFEKACRPPLSFPLVKGGYAWNGIPGTTQKAMGLSGEGTEDENVAVGNANFRKGIEGPLRSGIFAKPGSGQEVAGSTYWGIMEMSGNVQELCRNVNDWYFYWNRHGDGAYNPGIWNTSVSYYGVRGGGFTSDAEQLQVSDRSNRAFFTGRSTVYRDSTVGFRAVRTLEMGNVDVNPGAISAITTICPNVAVTIKSTQPASVSGMNNVPVRYEWYLNSVLLEGENADTLRYSNWSPGAYYNFVRKAICAIGEKMTNTVRIYVTSPVLTAGKIKGGTRCAPGVFTVENLESATMECDYPITYSWYINNVLLADSTREVLSMKWAAGAYNVIRRAKSNGLMKDAATTVTVTTLNLNPGQIYGGMAMETVEATITNAKSASVGCGSLKFSWYIDSVLVKGASGIELRHSFDTAGFYQVIRRVTASDNTFADAMDTIIVNSKTAICGKSNGTVVDDQENVYTVLPMADERCWMTQNMRFRDVAHQHAGLNKAVGFDGDNIRYHEGEQANDKKYGLHYNWSVAMKNATYEKAQGICPAGWYVPTDEEWRTLEMAYGMTYAQAATDAGWRGVNQGTQFKTGGTSRLEITLSGLNGASNFNGNGLYWTSTVHPTSSSYAYYRQFNTGATIYRYRYAKSSLFSVRCIRSRCLGNKIPEKLSPGAIRGGTAGVGFPYAIKTLTTATVSCGGIEYSWYIDDALVSGKGASLTHVFNTQGTYKIVRRATADNNIFADAVATVRVYPACGAKNYVLDDQANRYSIKEMGDARCWMTQNIRRTDIDHMHAGLAKAADTDGSNLFIHEGEQTNDKVYGCHYTWNVAMQGSVAEKSQGICPAGWYIATDTEWRGLETAYGMTAAQAAVDADWRGYDQGTRLKAGGNTGFNATLSGYSGSSNFGTVGYYWSSTRHTSGTGYAFYRQFHSGYATIYRYRLALATYSSVRCVRSMCYDEAPKDVNAGMIKGGSSSLGYPITIKGTKTATVSCGGLDYTWYIDSKLVDGAEGASLTYTFSKAGVYNVTRRATADNGAYAEVTVQIIVYAPCGPYDYVNDQQGNKYSVKEMADGRCWMTQNIRRTDVDHMHAGLNKAADVDGSNLFVHEGEQTNDKVYGCHYIWNVAMRNSTAEKSRGICPPGWYIPTDLEWRTLETAYGMTAAQAAVDADWRGYNQGTRLKTGGNTGFNATLSGYSGSSNFTTVGYYWSSTRHTSGTGYAFYRQFHSGYATVYRYRLALATYSSVRCIRSRCEDGVELTTVNAGGITGGSCAANYKFTVKNAQEATVVCGGLYYSWYVDGVLVPSQVGESLTYTFTEGKHKVVRRAMADNGIYSDAETSVSTYSACSGLNTVVDEQGFEYSVKEMADNRCWMTQNIRRTDINHMHAGLNKAADVDGSNLYTHEGEQANDKVHGCHYDWNVAMQGSVAEKSKGICPLGWYIPTDLEWRTLETAYGMTAAQAAVDADWRGYNEGTRLKAGGNTGFNATLSGYSGSSNFTTVGYYWSSTRHTSGTGYAFYRQFHSGYATVYRYRLALATYSSVRCIKATCYDADPTITTAGGISGGSTAVNYPIKIKNTGAAASSCGGLVYSWYVNGSLIANERAASLTWKSATAATYEIVRRVAVDVNPLIYKEAKTTVIVYSPCAGKVYVDDDQGNRYNVKEMADNRCWMIQNIRRTDINHMHAGINKAADVDGSNLFTHEGKQQYDEAHGCHYTWSVAMQNSTAEKAQGICPPGWYIPTDLEWRTLETAYGMTAAQAAVDADWRGYNEGTRLKAGGNTGFNATLSGYSGSSNFTTVGYYWSSTPHTTGAGYAFYRQFHNGYATIYRYRLALATYSSVRCIRSMCYAGTTATITSPGSIKGGSVGVNVAITIKSTKTAAVNCGGLEYSWYINNSATPLANQVGASLTKVFDKAGKYTVTRKATADNGTSLSVSDVVWVYAPCSGLSTVVDDQGNEYSVKEMADNRCWMTQNIRRTDINHMHAGLNKVADVDGSNLYTHDGVQTNDKIYGCHYTWNVAMQGSVTEKARGICPPGWYVPTDLEWRTLETAYGMTVAQAAVDADWRGYNQGTRLKAGGNTGFNATLSGYSGSSNFGTVGYYWSSSRHTSGTGYAFYRQFHSGYATVYRYRLALTTYSSLRCIKLTCYDTDPTITTAGSISGGSTAVNYPITIKNAGAPASSCGGLVYSWYVDGSLLANQRAASLTWKPVYAGTYEIVRRVAVDVDPANYKEAKTTVIAYSPCAGKAYVDDDQGNRYNVKEMADNRCWMIQNIRRTDINHMHAGLNKAADVDGSNLFTHEGLQANDVNHGCHYTWAVAMQNSTAEKAQGICPPGWYVPTDLEWRTLETAYGMTAAQAAVDADWRGYNQGTRLKAGGNTGFNATLSGYSGSSNFTTVGYYWSSTRHTSSTSYAFYRYFHSGYATVYRYRLALATYSSVRCIRSMCYAGTIPAITSAGSIVGGKSGVNYPFKVRSGSTAMTNCGGVVYSWYIDGSLVAGQVGASLTYTFTKAGVYAIKRRAMADNGSYVDATASVTIVAPCGGATTVADVQGNSYSIKEMADTRCWMTQNIRRTNVVHMHAGNSAAAGVDNSSTHNGVQANDKVHGCHYTWTVAMQNSTAEKAQGICPSGWHIPTDLEWRTLETAYGMTAAQAAVDADWRGYNQGTRLKAGGNTGFNATLSGYSGSSNFTTVGYYWSSTRHTSSTSYAFYRYFHSGYVTVYRYRLALATYSSVRCIKNE